MKSKRNITIIPVISAIILFVFAIFASASATNRKATIEFVESTPESIETQIETTPETEPSTPETEPVQETEAQAPVDYLDKKVKYTSVPQYFQTDYPDVPYGNYGTVSTHGCGITSLAMVASYLLDEELTPDILAEQFGEYNTKTGSKWTLFPDSAEVLGLTIIDRTWDIRSVADALKNGSVAIACCHENSIFTNGGHFIVLTGVNADGKIFVQDPYIGNYTNGTNTLKDGYENGFEQKSFYDCGPFWIYAPKGQNAADLDTTKYTMAIMD